MLSSNQKDYRHVGFRRDKKTVDEKGYTIMTLDYLRQLCKEQKGYVTPYLNDTLYLHYKGFSKISSDISHYTGLKSLWLECNAISDLENLESLQELRCLYLQENCLSGLTHIGQLKNLTILNISQNFIQQLPNELAELPHLSQLHASKNKFKTREHIQVLSQCPALCVLDLHHNQFETEDVLEVFFNMPQLSVLTLHANPLIPHVHQYRKTMILRIPTLTYLEDRPVSENERKAVEAWSQGGIEAEREERERQRQEERQYHQEGFLRLAQLQAEARARRPPSPERIYPSSIQRFHDDMVAKIEDIASAEEGSTYSGDPENLQTPFTSCQDLDSSPTHLNQVIEKNPTPIRPSQAIQLDGKPIQASNNVPTITLHDQENIPNLEFHESFQDLSIFSQDERGIDSHETENKEFHEDAKEETIEEIIPQEIHSSTQKDLQKNAW